MAKRSGTPAAWQNFLASFYDDSRSCVVTINFQTTNAYQQLALPGSLLLLSFPCQPDPAHPYYCCAFFLPLFAACPHSLTGKARPREQALRMTKLRRDNCGYLTRMASRAACAR